MKELAHCPAGVHATTMSASLKMLWTMNSLLSVAVGWVAMLTAMMLPALISPIYHVSMSSFAHRRLRTIALFLTGYGAAWTVVGALLIAIDWFLKLIAPQSYLPATGTILLAIAWQFSPIKQKSLNRCHSHQALTPFGAAADRAALRFGMTHGIWCTSSCWIWMLFAMLLPTQHNIAMVVVTILIFSERLEKPRQPSWRPRGLGRVTRIILAQTRIRFAASRLRLSSCSFGSQT